MFSIRITSFLVASTLCWLSSSSVSGDLIADLRADYVAGSVAGETTATTNPFTSGTGRWDYFAVDEENLNDMSLLEWDTVSALYENATDNHSNGSSGSTGFDAYPLIGTNAIFGGLLESDELFIHPGHDGQYTPSGQEFATLRWTAGVGETGDILITGALSKLNNVTSSIQDGVGLEIMVNGVSVYESSVAGSTTEIPWSVNTSINEGEHVDFILNHGPAEFLYSDSAALSAQIFTATPEPTSMLMFATAIGAAAFQRRRRK